MSKKINIFITCLRLKWLYAILINSLLVLINFNILYAATATLSWNPPVVNADGSNLKDLDGYIINIGTSPNEYTQFINVGNITTYILNDLVHDITYYFAITAYDIVGNESVYSNQESITIESATLTFNPEISISDTVEPNDDLFILFGDIKEFNFSDQEILVKNDGNANLEIGDIIHANILSEPFSIFYDNCSFQSLIPSDTCSVTVRFSPTYSGSFTEVVNIISNDANEGMITVSLSGNGLSLSSDIPTSESESALPKNKGQDNGKKNGSKWK